jgi:hypothetical protein
MNRKHLSAGLPAGVAASALFLLLISCDNQTKGTEKEEGPTPPLPPLCKSIPATDLQNQFRSSGSDRAVASIYPIKRSGDMTQKDFDLVIVLHDGKNAAAVQPADAAKFEKEAGYYVQYMKKHKVQLKDVPRSYYATVHRQDARAVQGLRVCIDLSSTLATYDFTGSVQPGVPSLQLDSAGKCPPECPNPPEPLERAMNKVIKKTYQ